MKTLKVLKYAGFGILGLAFVILVIFGLQALWNWLIPELFKGPVLTFWQTAGLFVLAKILFSGVAPGPQHRNKDKKEWRSNFRDKYREKCMEESARNQDAAPAEQA
jgi:hypothetical protein